MKTILTLFPTFHKGKPFWEKQNSSIKTAETNKKEILKTVRGILLRKTQIKIPIRVTQFLPKPVPEIQVPSKKPFIPGCLLPKVLHKPWRRIFRWLAKTSQEEMVIIAINRKGKKGKILLVSKEKMEIMGVQGQGITLENRSKKKIKTISRQIFLLIELRPTRILRRN